MNRADELDVVGCEEFGKLGERPVDFEAQLGLYKAVGCLVVEFLGTRPLDIDLQNLPNLLLASIQPNSVNPQIEEPGVAVILALLASLTRGNRSSSRSGRDGEYRLDEHPKH